MSEKCRHGYEYCAACRRAGESPKPKHQSDLLEKLDMIKEAVKRNPDEWWREIEIEYPKSVWVEAENEGLLCLISSHNIRLKPQRVKVEGWVDAELIAEARLVVGHYEDDPAATVAQALLDCVKEEGDGA